MLAIVAAVVGVFSSAALGQSSSGGSGPLSLEGITLSDAVRYATEHRMLMLAAATGMVVLFLWVAGMVTPGSLARAGLRDASPQSWRMWLFGGVLVLTTLLLAHSVLGGMPAVTGQGDDLRARAAPAALAYMAAAAVGFGLLQLLKRSAPKAGLGVGPMDLPIGVACFVLAVAPILLASDLAVLGHVRLTGRDPEPLAHATLVQIVGSEATPWRWVLIAVAVVGAPVVEEIIWRGFVQTAVLRLFGSPWAAIFFTSLGFAAVHGLGDHPVPYYALAPIFMLGVAMGLAFERTRRLGVPMAMHMAFNAANVYLAMRDQTV